MISIFSDSDDASTNDVLDWIYYFNDCAPILRKNDIFDYQLMSLFIKTADEKSIKTSDKNWYRRGHFKFSNSAINKNEKRINYLCNYYSIEDNLVIDTFYSQCKKNNPIWLNAPQDNDTNKITNLQAASDCGLQIPRTLISNKPGDIYRFTDKGKSILKDILLDSIVFCWKDDYWIRVSIKPTLIDKEMVHHYLSNQHNTENRGYLFLQQYIEKRYELRIFYLQGKFYTMAIFSQANERTKVDFRNYDNERPNRCIPYKLPASIEKKLDDFMKKTGINCGSIDMIYTPEEDYIFLEVNPIGQFQWLSHNCNYDIEKEIATFLIQE